MIVIINIKLLFVFSYIIINANNFMALLIITIITITTTIIITVVTTIIEIIMIIINKMKWGYSLQTIFHYPFPSNT